MLVVSVTSTEKVVCVSCRYFWDLVFLRQSQILQNKIWVSDQGLAAFKIANKPGLPAFTIDNKHAPRGKYQYRIGTESVQSGKLTNLIGKSQTHELLSNLSLNRHTEKRVFWQTQKLCCKK